MDYAERYRAAQTYDEMVASAHEKVELWTTQRRVAKVADDLVARAEAIPGQWHLLVLSEDWCSDSTNFVPQLDELAARAGNLDLRILARDANLDVMDQHLTDGTKRAIPVVIVLDETFTERGWWGPRPAAMQAWWNSPEAQALEKPERYKILRGMIARDRGRSMIEEILAIAERAAARGTAAQPSAATHGA